MLALAVGLVVPFPTSVEVRTVVQTLRWVLDGPGVAAPVSAPLLGWRGYGPAEHPRLRTFRIVYREWITAEVLVGRNEFVTDELVSDLGFGPTDDPEVLKVVWAAGDALGWVCGAYPTVETLEAYDAALRP
jgi:hypothetical protein